MIRVRKNITAPKSLSTTKKYDGEDVLRQLEEDHYKKCYLCERHLTTDFEVEHLLSRENYSDLEQNWENLFWSCGYCNRKKSDKFDDILNPVNENIEEEIQQTINFNDKQVCFKPLKETNEHNKTCLLLTRIHNGRTNKLRTKREENFFEEVLKSINNFERIVCEYLSNPTEGNSSIVKEELQIEKEYLGIKYWIIKSNPQLCEVFGNELVWNKQ